MAEPRKLVDSSEIVPGVFLGGAKASKDLEGMHAMGIQNIVNVAGKQHHPGVFCYHRCYVDDQPEESLLPLLPSAVSFIHTSMCKNQKTLVHCRGGISRSPTVVIAYLMKHHNMSLQEAFDLTKSKRYINPNKGFKSDLAQWSMCL
eukprot:TRINITY_DN27082_c0_g1_i1.p1 TRINITY_DN27082_c0_g1~~TRINITY_DN27082_c0_g1_i1.p1  ORF type:complete len:162 (+),score=25.91 TRINITY_DN27082_c0_g1_i1:50-487(+)